MAEEAPKKPPYLLLVLMPLIFVGSIAATLVLPDFISDAYLDWGLPFVISFWVGMGFTFAWDSVRYQMHVDKAPPGMMAAVGVGSAVIFLMMLGFDTLWSEPWLFGVAIWPGLALARPWFERRVAGPNADSSGERAQVTPQVCPDNSACSVRGEPAEPETRA